MMGTTTLMRCSQANALFGAVKAKPRNSSLPVSSMPINKGKSSIILSLIHRFLDNFEMEMFVLPPKIMWHVVLLMLLLFGDADLTVYCWQHQRYWWEEGIWCIVVGCWGHPFAIGETSWGHLCWYWIQIWCVSCSFVVISSGMTLVFLEYPNRCFLQREVSVTHPF